MTELQPHGYSPSATHMGDCDICGRVEDDSIHSPYLSPEASAKTDRAEIDLDKIRGLCSDIPKLIAAVKALRVHVAKLETDLGTAVLAQEGELAELIYQAKHQLFLDQPGFARDILEKALDTTLLGALARTRILDEIVTELLAIWSLIEGAEFEDINDGDDLVVVTIQAPQARRIRDALAALELAKEEPAT